MKKVEGETHLAMVFQRHPERWYQTMRQKNSSGPCDWHSRTTALRKLGRAIAAHARSKEVANG